MIVVTGANGFIGTSLLRKLETDGEQVRAIVRNGSTIPFGNATSFHVGDLRDDRFLQNALEGADAVVHLAGRAHFIRDSASDPEREFREANVALTERLARAAVLAGVRRLVFMSSVAAATGDTFAIIDDDAHPRPQTPYGRSKLEAEMLLDRYREDSGLETISLRPPAVYGPGARGNPLRLMQLVRKGIPLPFGALRGRRSFIAVQNLVEAIRAAIAMPVTNQGAYFVEDGTVLSTPEFVELIGRSLQKRARLINVPLPVLRLAGATGDAVQKFLPFTFPVTSYEIDRLAGSLILNGDRFRAASGFWPQVTPEAAMDEAAEWLVRSSQR